MDGLLDSLVGGIIHETLRYRSNIRPMAGVDTLTQASASSDSNQPDMCSGWETLRTRTATATTTKGGRRRVLLEKDEQPRVRVLVVDIGKRSSWWKINLYRGTS